MTTSFKYKVSLFDRNDKLMCFLEDYIVENGLSWTNKRAGGCANASITLFPTCPALNHLEAGANVKIYINSETSDDWIHVYSGYIVEKTPPKPRVSTNYTLQVMGYSGQLKNVLIGVPDALWFNEGTLISDILKSTGSTGFLSYIAAHTDIVIDTSEDYINTSSVALPNEMQIQKAADIAIDDLAQLSGNWTWGVDKDRKFFFRAPDTTSLKTVVTGGKYLASASDTENWDGIKNRVFCNDGNFKDIYEADADMVQGTSQTDGGTFYNCGTTSSSWLKQEFATSQATISSCTFRAKLNTTNPNLITTDYNMELATTSPNWLTYVSNTRVTKSTSYRKTGTQSLRIETYAGNAGAYYKSVAVTAGKTYSLSCWVIVPESRKNHVWRVGIMDSSTYTTFESYDFTGLDIGTNKWKNLKTEFVIPEGTTGINITFYGQSEGAVLYLDECSLVDTHKFRLYVSLSDAANLNTPFVYDYFDISSATVAEYTARFNYNNCVNDGVNTYALIFSSTPLSDDNTTPDAGDNEIYWKIEGTNNGAGTWII